MYEPPCIAKVDLLRHNNNRLDSAYYVLVKSSVNNLF
jgi:hypothetical protein